MNLWRRLRSMLVGGHAGAQPPVQRLTIDLVTESPSGAFNLILVEVGPWAAGTEDEHLRRIQTRLYDCADAAIDGHVAAKYPASRGRPIVIRLDTYDLPQELIAPFYERFKNQVAGSQELSAAISTQGHVQSLSFEYSARVIDPA